MILKEYIQHLQNLVKLHGEQIEVMKLVEDFVEFFPAVIPKHVRVTQVQYFHEDGSPFKVTNWILDSSYENNKRMALEHGLPIPHKLETKDVVST